MPIITQATIREQDIRLNPEVYYVLPRGDEGVPHKDFRGVPNLANIIFAYHDDDEDMTEALQKVKVALQNRRVVVLPREMVVVEGLYFYEKLSEGLVEMALHYGKTPIR